MIDINILPSTEGLPISILSTALPSVQIGSSFVKGDKGQKGDKGDKGDSGYTPVKGVDYVDGYTPVKGVDYFDGVTPVKGVDYFDGVTPVKGIDYFDGVTPIKGVDYFDGQKGDTGPQGQQGIQGQKGQKGDTGAQGPKGQQGIQGIQGEKGQQGVKGDKGDKGQDGYTPIKGVDYFDGEQGIQGPKGDKGDQGIQGEKGDKGEQGIQGIQGPKGDTGQQGIQGIQGIQGQRGPQGQQGIQGPKGEDGSDANVTSQNIISALGYTPIGQHQDISGKQDIISDLSTIRSNASEVPQLKSYLQQLDGKAIKGMTSKGVNLVDDDGIAHLDTLVDGITGNQGSITSHVESTIVHTSSAQKQAWNSKAEGNHTHSYSDLTDKPTIPSAYDDTAIVGRVSTIQNKQAGWDSKQDAISDLETIRAGASAGATALQSHQDISGKQDIITDLQDIRSGASLGATSIQSHQDISGKQDIISDLQTIRSGAALGATAIQQHQDISSKQDSLVSGTNIKTINGQSILGEGNITVSADSSDKVSLTSNESISGKKTFTYGTHDDPAIVIKGSIGYGGAIQIGSPQNTGYSSIQNYRKCSNYVHKCFMLINSDGSVKLGHKISKEANTTSTLDGSYQQTANIILNRTRLQYGYSPSDSIHVDSSSNGSYYHDILYDGYETDKLNTNSKSIIGAINELYAAIQSGAGSTAEDGTEVAY